jgi:hypothetical protein
MLFTVNRTVGAQGLAPLREPNVNGASYNLKKRFIEFVINEDDARKILLVFLCAPRVLCGE